jgi:hypothetical protein
MADGAPVVIAWMFPEQTSGWFTSSLAEMLKFDANNGRHICQENGGIISLSTGPRLAEARNQIVDIFAEAHPNAEWLLMIDTDMTFPDHLLEALLQHAHPEKAPIVGGLCFAGGKMNNPYPTVYKAVQRGEGDQQYASIERVYNYPRDAMVRVAATGGACLLMHRGALGAVGNAYGKNPDGSQHAYPWFTEGVTGPQGEPWGEDIIFCLRAYRLGIPIWVNTAVKLGHVKHQIIDEEYYDNRRRAAELTEQGAFEDLGTPLKINGQPARLVQPNRAERRAAARRKDKVS